MYIRSADLHNNVNSHMRKIVFPRTRICTVLSKLPHVEIHKEVCVNPPRRKYAFPHVETHMRSCISTCGNTPKIVDFPMCGNTHFLVYFHMRKFEREVNFRMSIYKRIREFPRGKACGNTQFFRDFHMRKYTWKCEFPRAEIRGRVYYRMR